MFRNRLEKGTENNQMIKKLKNGSVFHSIRCRFSIGAAENQRLVRIGSCPAGTASPRTDSPF